MNTSLFTQRLSRSSFAVILFVLVCVATFGQPALSLAADGLGATDQTKYTLLEPLPCIQGQGGTSSGAGGVNCTPGKMVEEVDFKTYVQYMFNLFIGIAAVAAVFMIVWGGFQYTTSASVGGKSDGLDKAKNAIYGLLLVLCSYLLLKTIDPRLVNIPDTLVTPLQNNAASRTAVSDFFGNLNQQLNTINAQPDKAAQMQTRLDQAAQSAEGDEALRQSLEDRLTETRQNGSSADVEALEKQIAEVDDRLAQTKASALLDVKKLNLDHIVDQTLNFDSPSTAQDDKYFAESRQTLNEHYKNDLQELERSGASPAQVQTLKDYKTYSDAMLDMNEQVSKVAAKTDGFFSSLTLGPAKKDAAAKIALTATQYKNVITDPALRSKIDEEAARRTALLK